MTVLTTFRTQINDWKVFKELHAESLLRQARELGATRYRVFRNTRDASDVLIVIELPTHDDAQEVVQLLNICLCSLMTEDYSEKNVWDDMQWNESR